MRLFYTGASADQVTQGSPITSLGGFISSTNVPSGVPGSLLSNLSQFEIQNGGSRLILVALKNTLPSNVVDLKIYASVLENNLYDIELGAVVPGVDSCGTSIFELITSPKSLPIGIEFVSAISTETAIEYPTLLRDAYLGIWIKQTIKPEAATNFNSCDGLYESFLQGASETSFPFDLCIDYTVE